MIQPQTDAIVLMAFSIAIVIDTGGRLLKLQTPVSFDGSKRATNNALMIWIPQRNHTNLPKVNNPDRIPKIKAGPALLQKATIRTAVL